jgi:hypothetical protein
MSCKARPLRGGNSGGYGPRPLLVSPIAGHPSCRADAPALRCPSNRRNSKQADRARSGMDTKPNANHQYLQRGLPPHGRLVLPTVSVPPRGTIQRDPIDLMLEAKTHGSDVSAHLS